MDKRLQIKIGQMIFAGFPSTSVDEQARRLVEQYFVGNFVLFARNFSTVESDSALCSELELLAYEATGKVPFIAVDQEGGAVTRISYGTALFPGAMALAASQTGKAEEIGYNCARTLRAIGVNTNFAPVLDVNLQAQNPIIGARAFSDQPELVAQLGVDVMHGQKRGKVLAAVKHFPGHGNVQSDSHLSIPVNQTKRAVMKQTEWLPFEKAFEAGADALMTSHVAYTDVGGDTPATLSPEIMTALLKEQGFQGIVITDCLEMDAIRSSVGIGEGAVLAIEAGCDVITFSHTFEAVKQAVESIYAAVESGRITYERIEASYQKIVATKLRYGLESPQHYDADAARQVLFDPQLLEFHQKVAAESITLLTESGGLQKLRDARMPGFAAPESLAQTGAEDAERLPLKFAELAAGQFGGKGVTLPLNGLCSLDELMECDILVLGLYNARFRPQQEEMLRRMERDPRPLVVVLLGGPYDAQLVQRADAIVAAYEYNSLSVKAVLDALDTSLFMGKCPVKLNITL